MKDLWKSGVLILLIIGALYILYLRECKRPLSCPPEGQVLLSQQTWDSIKALADRLPTVHIDTIKVKGDIIYVPAIPSPQPIPIDSTANKYSDSLVMKDINVWYDFEVRGELLSRNWKYKPIETTITRIDSIPYPKIVETEKTVEVLKNGLYVYGIAGGNKNAFLFGGGLDFLTKKETIIGYQYQKFGDINFHSVKLGMKIKFRRN